jgi:hypothetical protein
MISDCTCCKHNGKCYTEGSTWSDDSCTDYYCDMVNNGGQMMEAITSVPGIEVCRYKKHKIYNVVQDIFLN